MVTLLVFSFLVTLIVFNQWSIKFDWVPFSLYSITNYSVCILYLYQTQLKEKRKIKQTFEKYVSKTVVDEMLQSPNKLKFGGGLAETAVLFTDIKDFTSICEKHEPAIIVQFLRDYFTPNTQTILRNNGMLDKYIGDAIVALFNVPIPVEDYAVHACRAALNIRENDALIREKYANDPWLSVISTRIGISYGKDDCREYGNRMKSLIIRVLEIL